MTEDYEIVSDMPEDDPNHPYSDMAELFWPVVFLLFGIGIGGCLVLLYLTH